MVELQTSNLSVRVQFPSLAPYLYSSVGRASALQAEGRRFKSYYKYHGDVAQLGEQLLCKQKVVGSRPTFSTNASLYRRGSGAVCKTVAKARVVQLHQLAP